MNLRLLSLERRDGYLQLATRRKSETRIKKVSSGARFYCWHLLFGADRSAHPDPSCPFPRFLIADCLRKKTNALPSQLIYSFHHWPLWLAAAISQDTHARTRHNGFIFINEA